MLLHVITKKGKGYRYAEEHPDKYHGVSKFDIKVGVQPSDKKSISAAVGEKLSQMACIDDRIVAITAAMPSGTGLNIFEKNHPNRYYDVGIAEQHAVAFSAGLAKNGMKPYFAVYSSFLQRGYDQVLHDVCITGKNVTFLIDRAGLVGNDGETHHGEFDLSYLNSIPGITVMAPKDSKELMSMMDLSLEIDGPCAIRYPRGNCYELNVGKYGKIETGTYEVLKEGKDTVILAIGNMVKNALEAAEVLEKEGISVGVVNARFLKPIDEKLLDEMFSKYKNIVTVEDNIIIGGFGSRILQYASEKEYNNKVINIALPEKFIPHGSCEELQELAGISANKIVERIKKI